MQLFSYDKIVSQPQLARELADAGVTTAWTEEDVERVLVVQIISHGHFDENSEWVEEAPDSVEIGVPDGFDKAVIDKVVAAHVPQPVEITAPQQPLVAALEKMPPGQVVTASDLLAILRPDTMTADASPSPDLPAAGA